MEPLTMLGRIAIAAFLALFTLHARAQDYSAAQRAIFNTPHLANITQPVTLRYTYQHKGTLEQAFDDIVDVIITNVMPDGGRDVSFNFLSDKHHHDFPVVEGFHSNPVIMMFLEHDVAGLSSQTGGSALYFRNRIRDAFVDRATAEEVTVPYGDKEVPATHVKLQPFLQDPLRERFEKFAEKTYEFYLAPDVPGGVYSIRVLTPGGSADKPLEENLLQFQDMVE
jgi:hypothetical protein